MTNLRKAGILVDIYFALHYFALQYISAVQSFRAIYCKLPKVSSQKVFIKLTGVADGFVFRWCSRSCF